MQFQLSLLCYSYLALLIAACSATSPFASNWLCSCCKVGIHVDDQQNSKVAFPSAATWLTAWRCCAGEHEDTSPATELQQPSRPGGTAEESAGLPIQEDSQPFVAFGVPQASHNKEHLDTIAEEPLAETSAVQSQSSRAQAPESPVENTEQQPMRESEDGSNVPPRGDGAGSHASHQSGSHAAHHPRDVGDPGDAEASGFRGSERTDAEESNQAGRSNTHVPPKRSHHSLTGTSLSGLTV